MDTNTSSLFGISLLPGSTPFTLLHQNNTYGFFPVDIGTFNRTYANNLTYPKHLRDIFVTILAVHNLVLNILSYGFYTRIYSGVCRILTGASLCIFTLSSGNRRAEEGFPIQHWYDECLVTGAAQMIRGAIDLCLPWGCLLNAGLDGLQAVGSVARFVKNPFEFEPKGGVRWPHQNPSSSQVLMFVNAVAIPILFSIKFFGR